MRKHPIYDRLPSYLNRRQSRGKWYVSLRGASLSLIKGFEGTRAELDDHLWESLDRIVAQVRAHDRRFLNDPSYWRKEAAIPLHKAARSRAQRRDLPFSLTVEWIVDRLRKIEDRCEVSSMRFDYTPGSGGWHKPPLRPSLDRIDRAKGYQPENVRLVCTCVNISINEWGEETFFSMCEAVVKRRENGVQN